MSIKNFTDYFGIMANYIAEVCGSAYAFILALLFIVSWIISGFYYNWSDSNLLFINSVTTIITFLMGFLILNTANRSGKAEQLKLDEIIRALETASNKFIKLEQKDSNSFKAVEDKIKDIVEEQEKM